MDELFPIIMDMLQDSSSLAKRQVCAVNLLYVSSVVEGQCSNRLCL